MKSKKLILFVFIFFTNILHGKNGTIPKSFIKKFLPENPIIVEAGSHIGSDTEEMAKTWPLGFIFGFEPVPYLYQKIQVRIKNYTNVKCSQLALSSSNGTTTFYVSSGSSSGSSSLLKPTGHLTSYPSVHFEEAIQVETITLDDWVQREGIDHIDFMWLDLQGSEPDVLMASPNILKTVKAIYTEVSFKELYEGSILYPEFKAFLQKKGFNEIYEAYPRGVQGNVLFVKSEHKKIEKYCVKDIEIFVKA